MPCFEDGEAYTKFVLLLVDLLLHNVLNYLKKCKLGKWHMAELKTNKKKGIGIYGLDHLLTLSKKHKVIIAINHSGSNFCNHKDF